MAMLAASTAIVSACSTADPEPRVVTQIVYPEIPAAARAPCPPPSSLPDRRLSEAEATGLWGRDRANLRSCEVRRAAAVGFEQAAGLLRSLRDFLIEKFGLEDADKALPGYRLEWLDQTEVEKPTRPVFTAPTPKEPPLTQQPDPAFAAREADVVTREAAVKKREAEIAHADNVAFAEGLVTAGKLLPASKDKVVAILDALPVDATVSFAEGAAKVSPIAAIREVLDAQPKVVSFGQTDLPPSGHDGAAASFASDGKQVDADQLTRHEKALAYQRQHPGTAYLDAVRAVA